MSTNTSPFEPEWTPHQIPGLISWVEYNNRLGGLVDMLSGERVFPQEHGKEYRMPGTIKLLDLVTISNTRHLWPKEFDGLIKTWEETKSNDQIGIIADWLDDNDEPELAHAFRWCYKRKIKIHDRIFSLDHYIDKHDLHPSLKCYCRAPNGLCNNIYYADICGVMADLVSEFAKIREAIA